MDFIDVILVVFVFHLLCEFLKGLLWHTKVKCLGFYFLMVRVHATSRPLTWAAEPIINFQIERCTDRLQVKFLAEVHCNKILPITFPLIDKLKGVGPRFVLQSRLIYAIDKVGSKPSVLQGINLTRPLPEMALRLVEVCKPLTSLGLIFERAFDVKADFDHSFWWFYLALLNEFLFMNSG